MNQHIQPSEFSEKVFPLIEQEWMLITAGSEKGVNTMTASYGSLGILFGKPVAQIYVRPERFTYGFLEEQEYFSLSFFDEKYREKLQYCGRTSGRDADKIAVCGFTPLFDAHQAPYFKEARLTVICRKIYAQSLKAELLSDEKIRRAVYGSGGVHRMYVGEIVDIFYQN